MLEAGFPSGPQRKDEDDVDGGDVPVQRGIPTAALADHEFTLAVLDRTANGRAVCKYVEGFEDFLHPLRSSVSAVLLKVFDEMLQIVQHLGRQFDAGHGDVQRGGLRAAGRAAFLPVARAWM